MTEPVDCAQVERQLWEYLDRALPAEEAAAVRAHLEHCRGCGPICRCCRALLERVARCAASSAGASPELRERLRARLADGA
jgi:anti-sigma factor RsiW